MGTGIPQLTVDPYSDGWAAAFETERTALSRVLAPWLHEAGIVHVGSTAVPGLAAKPVIDILCGIKDLDAARAAFPAVIGLGYTPGSHRPHEAHWFHRDTPEGVRTHNMHLTVPGSALWKERLAFRDALRADPALAAEYERLKLELCAEHGTEAPDYTSGKRDLVARVLARALARERHG